jgi:hypothetical protein
VHAQAAADLGLIRSLWHNLRILTWGGFGTGPIYE